MNASKVFCDHHRNIITNIRSQNALHQYCQPVETTQASHNPNVIEVHQTELAITSIVIKTLQGWKMAQNVN
jgi:hypothetical protein